MINWNEVSEWVLHIGTLVGLASVSWYLIELFRRINALEKRWDKFVEHRQELYAALADANSIQEQMEKGERLREMRDANRTTLPRDDAVGQNAVVYRPRLRSKLPNKWRDQGPINRPEPVAEPPQND